MTEYAGERAETARFSTVVLDVDSTLSGVEGIDWLAGRRGGDTAALVRRLTEDAMSGPLALEDVYGRRLELVAPTLEEVRALAREYGAKVARGAGAAIAELRRHGVRVIAVSGGLRDAVVPVCREASLEEADVFAVAVRWDEHGAYAGYDQTSPLVTQNGKAALLRALALPRPILAVGDGSTDLAMKTAGEANAFAAYTEFVCRASVVAAADHVLASFDELRALVVPR